MTLLNTKRFQAVFAITVAAIGWGALPSAHAKPQAASPKAKSAAKVRTVTLSPDQSEVRWLGKKVTGQHNGTLKLKGGSVQLVGDEIKGGDIQLDMGSVVVEDVKDPEYNAKLVAHLKNDDFFSSSTYPVSSFKITRVRPLKGNPEATHEVTGDLTIKGQTHPVTFPAKVEVKDGRASAQAKVRIDRTRWNIRYGSGKFFKGLGDKMIDDQFELDFKVVGPVTET